MFSKIFIKQVLVLIYFFSNFTFTRSTASIYKSDNSRQSINKIEYNRDTTINLYLLSDYQQIFEFSEKMKSYDIDQTYFKNLFKNGMEKSLNFYQSPNNIKQHDINLILEKELLPNHYLKHPLKTPSKNISKNDKSFEVLNMFSGKWTGKWQAMHVEHLWLPTRKCNLKIGLDYDVIGFQTCFTGDGFGWNYLIRKGEEIIILGHVYHFNEKRTLDYENPHYAFLNEQSQLTWVSDNHIYYEFICYDSDCSESKHYVITAMPYTKKNKVQFGAPIQAIYESL